MREFLDRHGSTKKMKELVELALTEKIVSRRTRKSIGLKFRNIKKQRNPHTTFNKRFTAKEDERLLAWVLAWYKKIGKCRIMGITIWLEAFVNNLLPNRDPKQMRPRFLRILREQYRYDLDAMIADAEMLENVEVSWFNSIL